MNPKKAIKELEKQLRKDPDNLVLRLKLAANYREVGRSDEAVTLYRSVAVAYHAQGRLAQAIAVCKSVLEIEPTQPETQRLLAELDQMRRAAGDAIGGEAESPSEAEIPSLAPKARTPRPRRSSAEIRADARGPSREDFGPGSGMTPKGDRPGDVDDGLGGELGLPRRMADLRQAARRQSQPIQSPRTTERMSEPPQRHSGPLLTPTPLPEPLALHHDDSVSAPRPMPRSSLPGWARERSAGARSHPRPASEVDDDAMTRIAGEHGAGPVPRAPSDDDAMTRVADFAVPAPEEGDEVDFDGVTSPLPDGDDGPTVIAPDLPLASADDDDAMTRIADESGLLPVQQVPAAPAARRPHPIFDRDTRPIREAPDDEHDFDDLPTGAGYDTEAGAAEPPLVDADRVTRELEGEQLGAELALDDDFGEVTAERRHEDELTNPGPRRPDEQTGVRPRPLPPSRDSADDLRLARAFHRPFSDTIERLAPDGGVIDLPLSIFSSLPQAALDEMSRRMRLRPFASGEVIVSEGEPGDACFVIAMGEVRILKRDPNDPDRAQIEVARLGSGSLFGEFALLADRRRHATVQAVVDSEIYEIPRRLLRELAVNYPEVGPALERFYRERLLATLLWTAPFFKSLPEERRGTMLSTFEPHRVESGYRVVTEGEPAGGLYLIVLGSVEITKRVGERRSVLLATLGEGAYFGEMSLLRGDVASASVTAVGPTELAVMSPKDFYKVVSDNPILWDEVRREAHRRQLANNQIVAGETNVV